jgi:glycosyltransferase involved in cell wall biosynthesis
MKPDIICFSHLRWDFVYQRPQHLMTRMAREYRIFYFEEPCFDLKEGSYYQIHKETSADVYVVTPHLAPGLNDQEIVEAQKVILDSLLQFQQIKNYLTWYYSPMSYSFSRHLQPYFTVYDCMDELSMFLFAPRSLQQNEQTLLKAADLVFTGGHNLYQAKKNMHENIHAFPSSIDKNHFLSARRCSPGPSDQAHIPSPRIGFYGVLDERLDTEMLGILAERRPGWQFILVGPVVKINPSILPKAPNIHYLGSKQYAELPQYLSGWDIAMMPFALNDSTRFISPTKTPEYLAGGKPVISPSIADVITPYAELGLVNIADTPEDFIRIAEAIFRDGASREWLSKVDEYLAGISWEKTVNEMRTLINDGVRAKTIVSPKKQKLYV